MRAGRERCRSAPGKARCAIPAKSNRTERSSFNKERAEREEGETKAHSKAGQEVTEFVNDKRDGRGAEAQHDR